jgi:hypothetical protein
MATWAGMGLWAFAWTLYLGQETNADQCQVPSAMQSLHFPFLVRFSRVFEWFFKSLALIPCSVAMFSSVASTYWSYCELARMSFQSVHGNFYWT